MWNSDKSQILPKDIDIRQSSSFSDNSISNYEEEHDVAVTDVEPSAINLSVLSASRRVSSTTESSGERKTSYAHSTESREMAMKRRFSKRGLKMREVEDSENDLGRQNQTDDEEDDEDQSQIGTQTAGDLRHTARSESKTTTTAPYRRHHERSRRVLTNSKFDFRQKSVADVHRNVRTEDQKKPDSKSAHPSIFSNILEEVDGDKVKVKSKGLSSTESLFSGMKAKLIATKKKNLDRNHSPHLHVKLMEAVKSGDKERLTKLLDQNTSFNLNKLDKRNMALLHYSALSNTDYIARELLQRGADLEVKNLDTQATPLHAAARMNSVDVVHVLLARCANVESRTITGATPLHIGARRGNMNVSRVLVTLGKANVNAKDSEEATPMHCAAMSGNRDLCNLLADHGADIRAKDVNYMTPLMKAVTSGHEDLIDLFLEWADRLGISLQAYLSDQDNESNSCLHLAVSKRRPTVIQRLLDHGVDVNVQKTNGMSPLHIAAINGSTTTAVLLLENGADLELKDNEGMTPLHRATLYNRVETMALFIHEGAVIDEVDDDGFTPLLCAAWKGHVSAGQLLLTRGAEVNFFDQYHKSAVHWAAEMDHLDFMEFFLDIAGKSLINVADVYEHTPLHYAAEIGNCEMIQLLIDYKAEGEVRDILEKTPIHVAAQSGYVNCVEELLRHTPALLNEDDRYGMTPLLTACFYGNHGAVRALLKMGADISNVNDDHQTALMLASANNHVETMSILIEHNCDIYAVDKNLNTALHLCCDAGHIAGANILIRAGADQSCSNDQGFTPLELAIEREQGEIAAAIIKSKDWRVAMQSKDEQMISPMKALIEKLPDVALLVMDRCVHRTSKDPVTMSYSMKFDYQYIDPGPDDVSTKANNSRYFAVRTMCQYGREKLLAHPLSQSILKRKWQRFGRILYYVDMTLYIAFLTLLTIYSMVSPVIIGLTASYVHPETNQALSCPVFNLTGNPELHHYLRYDEASDGFYYVNPTTAYLAYGILAYCMSIILGELVEMYVVRLKYFTDLGNFVDWGTLISALIFVFPPGRVPCNHNWNAGIWALFSSWMKFIMYFKGFKTTGLYVLMFVETLMSIIKAMSVYIMFVSAFANAFGMCFWQIYRFSSAERGIMSIFTMMLGELNKDDIFAPDVSLAPFGASAYALFFIFLFIMPIVLNNLTIGIAVGDIDGIKKKAFIRRNAVQSDYVYHLEAKFPLWLQRIIYQPENITKVSKGLRTNKIMAFFFPAEDDAFVEADDKSEPRTAEHVLDEMQGLKTSLASLKLMVKQQGDLLKSLADKEGVSTKVQDIVALSGFADDVVFNEHDNENDHESNA
ncbi:uncharacterized protein [Diadema antillarum]|uniref:uncharacterized protein n=1 Tax=Diadema antillarum TaxID=105358 RepID=UPI003A8AAD49